MPQPIPSPDRAAAPISTSNLSSTPHFPPVRRSSPPPPPSAAFFFFVVCRSERATRCSVYDCVCAVLCCSSKLSLAPPPPPNTLPRAVLETRSPPAVIAADLFFCCFVYFAVVNEPDDIRLLHARRLRIHFWLHLCQVRSIVLSPNFASSRLSQVMLA